jgi:hypothetical protein
MVTINVQRILSPGMLSGRNQLKMSSGTLYLVPLFRTDVSGNVSSSPSDILRMRGSHSCIIAETLLLSLYIEGY